MKERIKNILSQRRKKTLSDKNATPAAVFIPIFEKNGEYHILFTKRTDKVEHHKGQISFPGGVYDEGDGELKNTALRECHEEVGIRSDHVEVLGELDNVITTTDFIVSPFVGVIPYPYHFTVCEAEIDELIEIPIPALLDEKMFREDFQIRNGELSPSYFFQYENHLIWGATARILKQFLELVFQQQASLT